MEIKINTHGNERKRLVKTIAEWLGEDIKYCGAPTFAYTVGSFTVEKDGTLRFDSGKDSDVVERLLEHLYDEGFDIDQSSRDADDCEVGGISIQMPMISETALANLRTLVDAKGSLIKKALGTDALPIECIDGRLDFSWFASDSTPEEIHAYMNFVTKLCEMAKSQTRVNAKEQIADNEKYAFRCFLLRLGFIGNEYKTDRKILLRNLSGSSAFKSGGKEVE